MGVLFFVVLASDRACLRAIRNGSIYTTIIYLQQNQQHRAPCTWRVVGVLFSGK